MNKSKNNTAKGSLFLGFLTVILAILKLAGAIEWGWLWVLAPAWIPTALVIVILYIYLTMLMVKEITKKLQGDTKGRRDLDQSRRDLDREAAAIGIERGKGESDRALAYRIKWLKDIRGGDKK